MKVRYDAEAFGFSNTRSRPWMNDTVWVILDAKNLDQLLAHEIFHVLADSGRHMNIPE